MYIFIYIYVYIHNINSPRSYGNSTGSYHLQKTGN